MATAQTTLPVTQIVPPPPRSKKRLTGKGAKKEPVAQTTADSTELAVGAVIKLIEKASDKSHRNTYETFRSFVNVSIAAIRRAPQNEWEQVCNGSERVLEEYSLALAELIKCAALDFKDVLGTAFMKMNLGSARSGQFFTGSHISEFMGSMTGFEQLRIPTLEDPIRVADLSCGSGAMLLAAAASVPQKWREQGLIWVFGVDISDICASMATLNLLIHGINGQIIRGDGLEIGNSLKMRAGDEMPEGPAVNVQPSDTSVPKRIKLSDMQDQVESENDFNVESAVVSEPPSISLIASLPQMTFDWTAPA